LTARHLEENGVATVIIGSALDIVEHAQAPRYLHNDMPLGNPLGHPYQESEQLASIKAALEMVVDNDGPSIVRSELRWHKGERWKENYMRVDESNQQALKDAGEKNRQERLNSISMGEKRT